MVRDYRLTLKASEKALDGFVYFTQSALNKLPLEPLDCLLDGPRVLMVKRAKNGIAKTGNRPVGFISPKDYVAIFGNHRGIKAYPIVVAL